MEQRDVGRTKRMPAQTFLGLLVPMPSSPAMIGLKSIGARWETTCTFRRGSEGEEWEGSEGGRFTFLNAIETGQVSQLNTNVEKDT